MYPTVRDFVDALARAGELRRVSAPVSPVLEIAALADRASKSPAPGRPSASAAACDPRFHHLGGPALLFERVEGSEIPVLINAWGSYRRMEMALGCVEQGFAGIAARIAELVKPEPPRSLREAVAKARQFLPLLRIPPRRLRGRGLCQQVVHAGEAADCTRLPIIRCWPHDGDPAGLGYPPGVNDAVEGLGRGPEWEARFRGRYITLAGIHTVHADDRDAARPASHNIGMYRVQLLGPRRLAMHWHMHHDGARHWRSWKALGEPMPVAIALGGESVMPYAATAPLPPGISELLLAGFLNRRGIEMVRAVTVPLWVPANAEIVIEGFVSHEAGFIGWDPRDPRAGPLGPGAVFEGPFGDHTGFYSLPDRYPVLTVTAITHRRDPIYPTTVVGLPPQEDYFLGKATERVFLPLLKTLIPDIEDYDLPMFGAFHNCAALQIRKHYPLQGRRVMASVWGAGQMAWTKTLFVVDDDVPVHDAGAVLRAAARRCHPRRDVQTMRGPLDILDHAAPRLGAGTKLGFDCTRKRADEDAEGVAFDAPPRQWGLWAAAGGTTGTVDTTATTGRDASAAPSPPAPSGLTRGAALVRQAVPACTGVSLLAQGWLMVTIRKTGPGQGRAALVAVAEAARRQGEALPPFLIVLGEDVPLADSEMALFHWLAHSDAGRDRVELLDGLGQSVLAFDATPKQPGDEQPGEPVRPWPPVLAFDEATRARLELRAAELGV